MIKFSVEECLFPTKESQSYILKKKTLKPKIKISVMFNYSKTLRMIIIMIDMIQSYVS